MMTNAERLKIENDILKRRIASLEDQLAALKEVKMRCVDCEWKAS